jgi:hypothetical protein
MGLPRQNWSDLPGTRWIHIGVDSGIFCGKFRGCERCRGAKTCYYFPAVPDTKNSGPAPGIENFSVSAGNSRKVPASCALSLCGVQRSDNASRRWPLQKQRLLLANRSAIRNSPFSLKTPEKPSMHGSSKTQNHGITLAIFLHALVLSTSLADDAAPADSRLQTQALEVLQRCCTECHGRDAEQNGAITDILNVSELLNEGYVTAGDPGRSKLVTRILDQADPMPPLESSAPRPTSADIQLLKAWVSSIRAAATKPSPGEPPANLPQALATDDIPDKFTTSENVFAAVEQYLSAQPPAARKHFRFLSLQNVANSTILNPNRKLTLSLYRMAVSKTLNSLSWSHALVVPEVIGPFGVVMVIDLRKLRDLSGKTWTQSSEWLALEKAYPYGLVPIAENRSHEFIQTSTRASVPIIRADWFVANSLRPDLYHQILGIPEKLQDLHDALQVHEADAVRDGTARRVGFTKSGVSKNANRLVVRYPARYGYFWNSYDFRQGALRGNIFQFPTGPQQLAGDLAETAFTHDGGEIIFSLPNGLHAFMLVSATGERLDAGPPDLVSDDKRVTGNQLIFNGISCITCHSDGLKALPVDEMPAAAAVSAAAQEFVDRLHVPAETDELFRRDNESYFSAARAVCAPFSTLPITGTENLPEPVSPVTRTYFASDLSLTDIAAELGVADVEALKNQIEFIPEIRDLGLAVLLKDSGAVKREDWEKTVRGPSKFQRMAAILKIGTPVRFIK